MNILSPSLLAADFTNLRKEIQDISEGGAKHLHIDVMDGVFVPNISFGIPVIKSIRSITDLHFDVHLMIVNPERYIKGFVNCGADSITVHVEATNCLKEVIRDIKELGVKAGVAINPKTSLSKIEDVLEDVDKVLVMSVNPGFGGQKYLKSTTKKISSLKNIIDKKGLQVDIAVDGGIKIENVQEVIEAGANIIVAGSGIFNEKTRANTEKFLAVLKNGKYLYWNIM